MPIDSPAASEHPRSHHGMVRNVGSHLGHEALLTLARKVHAAAGDGDAVRLKLAARRLLDALGDHLRDESVDLARLVPAEARILARGQTRLLALADELVTDASRGCPSQPMVCANRAEDLLARLVLQAKDERMAWHDAAA